MYADNHCVNVSTTADTVFPLSMKEEHRLYSIAVCYNTNNLKCFNQLVTNDNCGYTSFEYME